MSAWLVVPLVAIVVGWLLGRWRGALIALVTSFVWLAILREAIEPGLSELPSWVDLARAEVLLLVTLALATELRRATEWVQRSHRHNPRTGLVQSDSFAEVVDAELDRAFRYDRPCSLVYLKSNLLASSAAGLRAKLRSVDLVANLREGEFAVLLPETDEKAVRAVMHRLQEALPAGSNGNAGAGGALGAVTVAGVGIDAPSLIDRARALMLESARDITRATRQEVLAPPSPQGLSSTG